MLQKALQAEEAPLAYEDFCRAPLTLLPTRPYAMEALRLAQAHGRSFHDSLYLAMAIAEDALFMTADRKCWKALKGTPLARHIQCL